MKKVRKQLSTLYKRLSISSQLFFTVENEKMKVHQVIKIVQEKTIEISITITRDVIITTIEIDLTIQTEDTTLIQVSQISEEIRTTTIIEITIQETIASVIIAINMAIFRHNASFQDGNIHKTIDSINKITENFLAIQIAIIKAGSLKAHKK